nr:beta-lactamase family protein [Lysobacter sp.]
MPRMFAVMLAALCCCLPPLPVHARQIQDPPTAAVPAEPAVASDTAPRAIDPDDLSAYVDGLVDAAMQRDGIAGVTVAIVDRNGPLLLRGYGIAAQSPRREVDPRATMFRIGSVSKTFTYLLALKLIDAGRLDLDAPVNDYLPAELRLPDDGRAPVLVRHLLTHSAGFEDSAMGHLFVERAEAVLPTSEYLQRHRPKRVREPGEHAVYSNYSVVLLGALLAHVEGVDFDTLVERELFKPMGMRHNTFREPLTAGDPRNAGAAFKGRWSEGFERKGGSFKPQGFEHIAHAGPAGSASSTAQDMARYMRMLLNGGRLDDAQVLPDSAYARLIDKPLFRNAPEVGGFSHGFFNTRLGDVELFGHGGATGSFHCGMEVAPALGVGVFISTNTATGRRFAGAFAEQVLERYFEQARTPAPA